MRELRPGVWHWQSPHPGWNEGEEWPEAVSSYGIELGNDFVLFDPLAVPDELRERATAVVSCGATESPTAATIRGRGAERSRLERRAAALGIRDRVEFAGFVSDAERDAWLARSRVCVCASHKEGFGLTVIEANAVGTPNVASDAPGLRDTVRHGETGFLVAEPDPASFAERIDALLGDDALAERMSRAALAWSQRFDWEIAAGAMERSLHRAASSRAQRGERSPADPGG